MSCAPDLTIMGTLNWTHYRISGSVLCQDLKPELSGQSYHCQAMDQDPSLWVVQPKMQGLFRYLSALLLAPGPQDVFAELLSTISPSLSCSTDEFIPFQNL